MDPKSDRSRVMQLLTCPECGGECHYTRGFVFCVKGRDCFPRRLIDGDRELLLKHFPNRATHSEANPIQ